MFRRVVNDIFLVVVRGLAVRRQIVLVLFGPLCGDRLTGRDDNRVFLTIVLVELLHLGDRLGLVLTLIGPERKVATVVRQLRDIPLKAFVVPLALGDVHDVGKDAVWSVAHQEDARLNIFAEERRMHDERVLVAILNLVFVEPLGEWRVDKELDTIRVLVELGGKLASIRDEVLPLVEVDVVVFAPLAQATTS